MQLDQFLDDYLVFSIARLLDSEDSRVDHSRLKFDNNKVITRGNGVFAYLSNPSVDMNDYSSIFRAYYDGSANRLSANNRYHWSLCRRWFYSGSRRWFYSGSRRRGWRDNGSWFNRDGALHCIGLAVLACRLLNARDSCSSNCNWH